MYVVEAKETEKVVSYVLKAAWSEGVHTGHETWQERVHWRYSGSKALITGRGWETCLSAVAKHLAKHLKEGKACFGFHLQMIHPLW